MARATVSKTTTAPIKAAAAPASAPRRKAAAAKAEPVAEVVEIIAPKKATKAKAPTPVVVEAPSPAPAPVSAPLPAARGRKVKTPAPVPEAVAAYTVATGHNGGPPLEETAPEAMTEVIEAEGLAEWVGMDRLIKSLGALKTAREAVLKPILSEFFIEEARKLPAEATLDDLPKNFAVHDGPEVSAKASLRRKPAPTKGFDAKAQAVFRRHNIPLKKSEIVFGVNSKYLGANAEPVWLALMKLVGENPKAGVPMDFFSQSSPVVEAPEDVIIRALRLGPDAAREVLPLVSTIAISEGEGGEDTITALTKQIEAALAKVSEEA